MSDSKTESGRYREIIYEPSNGTAGLAVSTIHNPGPHETKYVVEQLWPPSSDGGRGRAEPIYIGDETRVASLIEALAGLLESGLEAKEAKQ